MNESISNSIYYKIVTLLVFRSTLILSDLLSTYFSDLLSTLKNTLHLGKIENVYTDQILNVIKVEFIGKELPYFVISSNSARSYM